MNPTLRFEQGAKVVPGDRIGTIQQQQSSSSSLLLIPGVGTYARGGNLCASVLGKVKIDPIDEEQEEEEKTTTTTSSSNKPKSKKTSRQQQQQFSVSVIPIGGSLAADQVLRIGQMVLCRVVRVSAPQATVEILAVESMMTKTATTTTTKRNNHLLPRPLEGTIQREEAVKSGTNHREIHECFQPSDVVLARVLSLGTDTGRRYILTTAETELGVIHAICYNSQKPMIPCSYKEMECPDTGTKEPRKCAKPRKISISTTTNSTNSNTDNANAAVAMEIS